nr:hypothetical protein [Neisseria shayeganii]
MCGWVGAKWFSGSLRPLQNPHLWRISALCAARSLAYLDDMSALAALLRLELHPHLGGAKVSACLLAVLRQTVTT